MLLNLSVEGNSKLTSWKVIPFIENKLNGHHLWLVMDFGRHSPGFYWNEQIPNSLTTCHPVRVQEALSLKTEGKDGVMMQLYLHSQSNEWACFWEVEKTNVSISWLCTCRPSV